jgi:hypothetical protein
MGKTYKRNREYKPKQHGKVFVKDQRPWKKNKGGNKDGDLRQKETDHDYDPSLYQ